MASTVKSWTSVLPIYSPDQPHILNTSLQCHGPSIQAIDIKKSLLQYLSDQPEHLEYWRAKWELQPHPLAGDQSKSWLWYSISLERKNQLSTISVTFSFCCSKKKKKEMKKKRKEKNHKNSCTNYFTWAHPNFSAGWQSQEEAASATHSRAANSRAALTPLEPGEPEPPLPHWWMCSSPLWKSPGSCALGCDGFLGSREALPYGWTGSCSPGKPGGTQMVAALDNLTGKHARNRKCNQLSVMQRSRWGEEA